MLADLTSDVPFILVDVDFQVTASCWLSLVAITKFVFLVSVLGDCACCQEGHCPFLSCHLLLLAHLSLVPRASVLSFLPRCVTDWALLCAFCAVEFSLGSTWCRALLPVSRHTFKCYFLPGAGYCSVLLKCSHPSVY